MLCLRSKEEVLQSEREMETFVKSLVQQIKKLEQAIQDYLKSKTDPISQHKVMLAMQEMSRLESRLADAVLNFKEIKTMSTDTSYSTDEIRNGKSVNSSVVIEEGNEEERKDEEDDDDEDEEDDGDEDEDDEEEDWDHEILTNNSLLLAQDSEYDDETEESCDEIFF